MNIYNIKDFDIKFSQKELDIFNIIKDIAVKNNTVARVAGGYIRDKILCIDSSDIDIAVSNMTGEQFARLIDSKKVTVVKANPDQSKHLATAMVRIHGLPIDFVNLRAETYSESRIPEMRMGTPEEDARRRDLTLNSLFWNINTGEIEDYVGGVQDLENRIARTPMDPVQTFLDDPLRILRTVRFAARFGLELDPALIAAAQRPEVQEAFRTKISNERIWAELAGKKEGDKWKAGALIGPNPSLAVVLLKQLGLMEAIFDPSKEEMEALGLPERMVPWETNQDNPHHAFDIWEHTFKVFSHLVNRTPEDVQQDHETYLVRNLVALLHDIGKRYVGIQGTSAKGHTNYHGHEDTSAVITEKVLTRLHAPQDIIKRVCKLIEVHLRPHIFMEQGSARSYRKFVRGFEDWNHSIDIAIADSLGKKDFEPQEHKDEVQKYEDLRSKIIEALPSDGGKVSVDIPRPINGHDLKDLGITPGPTMGQIMKAIDEALLDDPLLSRDSALEIARTFL